ncbi:MAG: hypothetical protein P0Y49_19965 [Candidatus Pedobacter colombiensis]|uniref:Uncharacterized protein n=1 Tax=Candidatus Pedobacter colombiensis TaxID=3121371 RepID=A0AAJ5W6L3_9SPHI|nr:hypothetical protein [Pedobacter sp.]WEK19056.1 MAG: hypothetical protein P0Y49_19965 [Pedobacter sp.]
MRHIVTLSLVFFSLTHLAKAERIEGLRLVTKYCNSQQVNKEASTVRLKQVDEERHPFFLSYSALSSIGLLPEQQIEKHRINNYIIVDLTIKEQTKNNSP